MCLVVQVMTQRHNLFERHVLILRAGAEPLTADDQARLEVSLATMSRRALLLGAMTPIKKPCSMHAWLFGQQDLQLLATSARGTMALSTLHAQADAHLLDKFNVPLQKWGVRECALGWGPGRGRVPEWLQKWAALVLEYVEEEQELLPPQLLAIPPPAGHYTPLTAAAEAKGGPPPCQTPSLLFTCLLLVAELLLMP